MNLRMKIVLIVAFLIFGFLNYAVYEKEQIKEHGVVVLLELAPVDPRSLMQGDYMALEYAIARKVTGSFNPTGEPLGRPEHHGQLIIALDTDGIGQFASIYNGQKLTTNERLMAYFLRGYRTSIRPDAFFFQEGHAKYYETAKYGIFKFDDAANYLLIGLADAEGKRIVPPKKDITD